MFAWRMILTTYIDDETPDVLSEKKNPPPDADVNDKI
jgi:hypothetical protein